MQQRGKPCFLCLRAAWRTGFNAWHTSYPTRCPGRVLSAAFPRPTPPSLHHLRPRPPDCSAASRALWGCLTPHARTSQAYDLSLPRAARQPITPTGKHGTSRFSRMKVPPLRRLPRPRGVPRQLAKTAAEDVAFRLCERRRQPKTLISRLSRQPTRTLSTLHPHLLPLPAHDSGSWAANSSI
jgi:hypothetical protein